MDAKLLRGDVGVGGFLLKTGQGDQVSRVGGFLLQLDWTG